MVSSANMSLHCITSASVMPTFTPRNGKIFTQVRLKGYPTKSKTHRNLTLAKKWAQNIEDEMRLGVYDNSPDVLLGDMFEWFKSELLPEKKAPKYHLTNLKNLAPLRLIRLGDFNAAKALHFIKSRDVSPSTRLKEINSLNNIIENYCAFHDIKFVSPIPQVKKLLKNTGLIRPPKPSFRRLADGEEERLMSALKGEDKLVAMLTLLTGRRLKEILQISPETLYLVDGKLHLEIVDNKTNNPINVELPQEAVVLLQDFTGFTRHPNSVTHAIHKANKLAGLTGVTLTKLRKEAYSRMFESGKNIIEVMAISGHASPDMLLKIYASAS